MGWASAHETMPICHDDEGNKWMMASMQGKKPEMEHDSYMWMLHDAVDWPTFADLSQTIQPVSLGSEIQQLLTGHFSILKGGAWNYTYRGVMHRSPPGKSEQLLLSLGQIFKD